MLDASVVCGIESSDAVDAGVVYGAVYGVGLAVASQGSSVASFLVFALGLLGLSVVESACGVVEVHVSMDSSSFVCSAHTSIMTCIQKSGHQLMLVARRDLETRNAPKRVPRSFERGITCETVSLGSSPRVRGTLTEASSPIGSGGIIPARAGNIPQRSQTRSTPWDHPRACGEHSLHHSEFSLFFYQLPPDGTSASCHLYNTGGLHFL